MKLGTLIAAFLVLVFFSSAAGFEQGSAFQIREDFGEAPLAEQYLSYYYFIPCTTSSWYWMFSHFDHNDIIGAWFQIGDISTGSGLAADPLNCRTLDKIRVLDFGGMGSYDIGDMFTVRFDVWCADEQGCPIGPSLWNSGPVEFYEAGWNYIQVNPPISICSCAGVPGPTGSSPRVLVTATATGSDPWYPAWGTDNISTPVSTGCLMHDTSCLPALYPRPTSSNYSSLHSGYYGNGGFQYCPAQGFRDGADTSQDGSVYGCVELAWRIYVDCTGPSSVQPVTWGAIKSMYK